jgi:hypothetical protein
MWTSGNGLRKRPLHKFFVTDVKRNVVSIRTFCKTLHPNTLVYSCEFAELNRLGVVEPGAGRGSWWGVGCWRMWAYRGSPQRIQGTTSSVNRQAAPDDNGESLSGGSLLGLSMEESVEVEEG